MMNEKWRKKSLKIILGLFFISVILFAFSFVNTQTISSEEICKVYGIEIGESVAPGGNIAHSNDTVKVPLLSKPQFLLSQILCLDLDGIFKSITTGTVNFDLSSISAGGIDSEGKSTVSTPGFVELKDNKLLIKEVNGTIYGRSYNYKYLNKTNDGFDLIENGTKIKSISVDQIRSYNFTNETTNGTVVNNTAVANFYNEESNKVGSIYPLEYGVRNINDGRNNLTPQEVQECFNANISSYASSYPEGDPIILYMPPYTEVNCTEYSTTLGDYSQYGNSLREYNARTFCEAWNNTIIPPNSSSSGKTEYSFQVASDSASSSGGATHGVCPSGRALRDAVLAQGFPMPTGITSDESCILYGYHPTIDIIVSNNGTVPVKINMWTTGSGTGMVIHCKLIKLVPNDQLDNYDLTNSTTKVSINQTSV